MCTISEKRCKFKFGWYFMVNSCCCGFLIKAHPMALTILARKFEKGILFVNSQMLKRGCLTQSKNLMKTPRSQSPSSYVSLLQICADRGNLAEGKLLHAQIIEQGLFPGTALGTNLLKIYCECGEQRDARQVLEEMPEPSIVSCTIMITAAARNGSSAEALELFRSMLEWGLFPDQFVFASLLTACRYAAPDSGSQIHGWIIKSGFESDVFVGNGLIYMYTGYDNLDSSLQVFEEMTARNVASWTAATVACVRSGEEQQALGLYHDIRKKGLHPNEYMLACLISVCGKLRDLKFGLELHRQIICCGLEGNLMMRNGLVEMYARCGCLSHARILFDSSQEKNMSSSNAMLEGYACAGRVAEALEVFGEIPERNLVSWTNVMAGCANHGHEEIAVKLYLEMVLSGIELDQFVFSCVLSACAGLRSKENGEIIHGRLIKSGFHDNVFVGNATIDMYCKSGDAELAQKVFDRMSQRDLVSWNAIISGYAQNGCVDKALLIFQEMPERNAVTLNAMITGFLQNGYLHEAWDLFEKMPEFPTSKSLDSDELGSVEDRFPARDIISWNAMITGFVQNESFGEAFSLFQRMREAGYLPNSITFFALISACADMPCLQQGQEVHGAVVKSGFGSETAIGNSFIDMYAKCGSVGNARLIYEKMPVHDVVSWNAMICAYAVHGCAGKALKLFEQMQVSSFKPNRVTFLGVLCACSHSGLVDIGWHYFTLMRDWYHIKPTIEHYCCITDILGRAGLLKEAENFILEMPMKPNASLWRSLLGSCVIYNNIELGERVADKLFQSDPNNAAHYVLLSNMYALANRWDDVSKIRTLMKNKGIVKPPGCSWIEINYEHHTFIGEALL